MKINRIDKAKDNQGEYNAIFLNNGTVILNRVHQNSAAARPLDGHEELINDFCSDVLELKSAMQEFVEEAKSFKSGDTDKDGWLDEWVQDFERMQDTP